MKKTLVTLAAGAVMATGFASATLASGPTPCDIDVASVACQEWQAVIDPTPEPTVEPTATPEPTQEPTSEPTPTVEPTPSAEPTATPIPEPTCDPQQPVDVDCRDDSASPVPGASTTDQSPPADSQFAGLPEAGPAVPIALATILAGLYYGQRWVRNRRA